MTILWLSLRNITLNLEQFVLIETRFIIADSKLKALKLRYILWKKKD